MMDLLMVDFVFWMVRNGRMMHGNVHLQWNRSGNGHWYVIGFGQLHTLHVTVTMILNVDVDRFGIGRRRVHIGNVRHFGFFQSANGGVSVGIGMGMSVRIVVEQIHADIDGIMFVRKFVQMLLFDFH